MVCNRQSVVDEVLQAEALFKMITDVLQQHGTEVKSKSTSLTLTWSYVRAATDAITEIANFNALPGDLKKKCGEAKGVVILHKMASFKKTLSSGPNDECKLLGDPLRKGIADELDGILAEAGPAIVSTASCSPRGCSMPRTTTTT